MTPIYRFIWILILLIAPLSVMSQEDRLQIVASHSILGDVISNVAGDVADVTLLIPVGADPHSFEPTPSDLTAISKADLVFTNGAFFEEGLLESIENAGEEALIIEASGCVNIIALGLNDIDHDHEDHDHEDHDDETHEDHDHEDHDHEAEDDETHDHEDHDNEAEDHDHDHEADEKMENLCNQHDLELMSYAIDEPTTENDAVQMGRLYAIDCGENHDGEDHDGGHHAEGGCDPHVWMNPTNVMYWVMLARDTLIDLDPANTDIYTVNAEGYMTELVTLVEDVIIPLVETLPPEKRYLITSHDSLGYLTTTFGFKTIGTIIQSGSTLAEPSVQDIVKIVDVVRAEEIPAIFGETTLNDNIAQSIADEAGVTLVILHSGSLSDETGSASTYIDYIRSNYTAIIEALADGS